MKLKILLCIIIFLLMCNTITVSSKVEKSQEMNVEDNFISIDIEVAILVERPLGNFVGRSDPFPIYTDCLDTPWMVGNKCYKFICTRIYDEDILNGNLSTNNFDLLIVPGGNVGDAQSVVKGFYRLPKTKQWKNNIAKFIKDGGGYCSHCGGTAMFTELSKKPETFFERQYDKSSIGVSCVKSFYKNVAFPIFYPLQRLYPEKVGVSLAYFAHPCMDIQINKDHPIFNDFFGETRRINWYGGPALIVPENPDREVNLLSRYPEDLSENKSIQIHVWKYTGGFFGLIRGLVDLIKYSISNGHDWRYILSHLGVSFSYAKDWKKTDQILDLGFDNKPCTTAEIYPNENQGRIVLDCLHPEYPISFGGHIEEAEDTRNNCLRNLFDWVDIGPSIWGYNNWIVRRQVAWASKKVPDNELPAIYGSSQVCNKSPYQQSFSFGLVGNVNEGLEVESVDLYYRFSHDNSSWSNWTFYSSDDNISDGWSWEFNSLDGSGYYQFYSIIKNEEAPPGPDASVYVEE